MKVCVLQPSYEGSASAIAGLDPPRDLTPLLPGHTVEHVFLRPGEAARALREHPADVYVNLCDGAWDEPSAGIDVVRALERTGSAFTGAGSAFYDPTRLAMKLACSGAGVDSAPYVIARTIAAVEAAVARLRLPCFVKPEHGYNSVGIDRGSRVETADALRARAAQVIRDFGGALIEEYIEGREFSVLVASDPDNPREPLAFLPVESLLDAEVPFKTFDFKWRDARDHWVPCDDPGLAEQLVEATRAVFTSLGGEGYARSDLRVDAKGRVWLLEINPNCSVFYPEGNGATADLILALDGAGPAAFLAQMIAHGLQRQRAATRAYTIRYDVGRGHGLYAARDLAAGETLYSLEEAAQVLVTRSHVERTWDERGKDLFRHYAWPLTDEVWVLWAKDPEDWRPLNHACDPNAWMDGLAVTARRSLRVGEEITFDYATMYTSHATGFACTCEAAGCRGGWAGDDHLQPWFLERYGDHVTDYVRASQARHGLRGDSRREPAVVRRVVGGRR